MNINFNDMIAPTFEPVLYDILESKHAEYWLKGGRASGKSSYISLMIPIGLLREPEANAIVYRRVSTTLKDSVYSQIVWAIDQLQLIDYFKFRSNPLEITYKPTGQRIMFRGMDDPMKSKSIKLERGYFKYLWVEELAELKCFDDVRTIQQSVFRGTEKAITLFSYNPPRSANAWVNAEVMRPDPRGMRYIHTSTYLDVPPEWLKSAFIEQAESLKESNPMAYRNEYLGEITGNGGSVFENVHLRTITDDEINGNPEKGIAGFEWFYQGVDWGYFPDPFAWVRCAFDSKKRILYIVDEVSGTRLSNFDSFNLVREKLRYDEPVTADSAEPKSIGDWRGYGCNWIRGANKGVVGTTGSVAYSMKWLASLKEIVIDPKRAPLSAKEFVSYEYERNAAGEFVSGYVDKENHCLTADTIVNTTDGDIKIVDLIGKSGTVYCIDESTGKATTSTFYDVRQTGIEEIYEIELEDGRTIECSGEHPILTERGWIPAHDLTDTDSIIQIRQCCAVKIKRIKRRAPEPVYNMEVERFHNFAVNGGLIVHNCIDAARYACSPIWRRRAE